MIPATIPLSMNPMNINPMRFGGQQEGWEEKSHDTMCFVANRIQETLNEGDNPKVCFFSLLDDLGLQRQEIAQSHRTPNANLFGARRDRPSSKTFHHTILDKEYEKTGQAILQLLAKKLKPMMQSGKISQSFGYPNSKMVIQILSGKELEQKGWNRPLAINDFAINVREVLAKPDLEMTPEDFKARDSAYRELRETQPKLYERALISTCLLALQQEFPSPPVQRNPRTGRIEVIGKDDNLKSIYVVATIKLVVKGKLETIGHYITWMYRNHQDDPVERMVKCSKVMIVHMDKALIPTALDDISNIFAQIIQGNLELMPEFAFKFAFTMPYDRGSAAIREWMEGGIHQVLNNSTIHNVDGVPLDLRAFAMPILPSFANHYGKGEYVSVEDCSSKEKVDTKLKEKEIQDK